MWNIVSSSGVICCLWLSGIVCLLLALFPAGTQLNSTSPLRNLDEVTNVCNGTLPAPVEKVVLVVIDAWRLSFLTEDPSMKFVRSSVEDGYALAFRAHVQTPTVTMPRIKALTSGAATPFSSLLFNFASSADTEDSWLKIAKASDKRIHFFGDDTWISLYGELFDESEGVVSFFVKDYTEVDNNVTRHLHEQFSVSKFEEWDILILHYLGLDHIGHSLGGQSEKIPSKLAEMDSIIETIVRNLQSHDPSASYSVVVVGDHGMTSAGGHGGSSPQEVYVPVVIWTSNMENTRKPPSLHSWASLVDIEQVDVCGWISDFLGIPWPTSSLSLSLATSVLYQQEPFITAHYLAADVERILLASESSQQIDGEDLRRCQRFLRSILEECNTSEAAGELSKCAFEVKRVQQRLLQQSSSFQIHLLIASIVLILMVCCILFKKLLRCPLDPFFITASVLHFCSFFSSSFVEEEHEIWYFIFASAILVKILRRLRSDVSMKYSTRSSLIKSVLPFLFLLICHRISVAYSIGSRRRYNMAEGTFPGIFVDDCISLKLFATSVEANAASIISTPSACLLTFVVFQVVAVRETSMWFKVCVVPVLLIRALDGMADLSYFNYVTRALILCGLWFSVLDAMIIWVVLVCRVEALPLLVLCYVIGRLCRKKPDLLIYAIPSAFFYTGNSNSISTVDISVGYAGLETYIPVIVGAQILLNTYAAVLIMVYGYRSGPKDVRYLNKDDDAVLFTKLCLSRALILLSTIIAFFVFSSHLFVFSVFAPKCLIETTHSLVFLLIVIFLSFRSKLAKIS